MFSNEFYTIVREDLKINYLSSMVFFPNAIKECWGYLIFTIGVSNFRVLDFGVCMFFVGSQLRLLVLLQTMNSHVLVSSLSTLKTRKRERSRSYSSGKSVIGQEMQLSILEQLQIKLKYFFSFERQLMNIKKTEEFTYFQNKAKHYENIRKIKPATQSWRASIATSPTRKKPHMIEYDELKANEALVNNILSIQHSPRSRVEVQNGHTRYNNFEGMRKSQYKSFKTHQRNKSIDIENSRMGYRILNAKPSIGTITDWNHRYGNIQSRRKLASKVKQGKMISLYSRDQFVPEHYKTFLARDGSTMVFQQKLFELPKIIAGEHQTLNHTLRKGRRSELQTLDLDWKKIIKDSSGDIYPSIV